MNYETITIAQLNPILGDIKGNCQKIAQTFLANSAKSNLIVFTECVTTGYPLEDLVLNREFVECVIEEIKQTIEPAIHGDSNRCAIAFGTPWLENDKIYNSVRIYDPRTKTWHVRHKTKLPNYGVFDEKRVFAAAEQNSPVVVNGWPIGFMVCEDIWFKDVAKDLKDQGAELLVAINGSPFEIDKYKIRQKIVCDHVKDLNVSVVYTNQVGGQDELIFDGGSFIVDRRDNQVSQMPFFQECVSHFTYNANSSLFLFDIDQDPNIINEYPSNIEQIYLALVLGLRDYVNKSKFPGVLLGMSGGIDSSLAAIIAADALGSDRVWGVSLPSIFTSQQSKLDASAVATNIGMKLDEISIANQVSAQERALSSIFKNTTRGVAHENIQSRMRGLTLMALSNQFGHMVLSTGNKSEVSVGYFTVGGDALGGYNILKDIYKTTVFDLCKWRNQNWPKNSVLTKKFTDAIIPNRIITKAPSAELAPNQKDQDSLPPYDILDAILVEMIEKDQGIEQIVKKGFDKNLVVKVYNLVHKSEYKRRMSPPGLKITSKLYGKDRRYPIVNWFNKA